MRKEFRHAIYTDKMHHIHTYVQEKYAYMRKYSTMKTYVGDDLTLTNFWFYFSREISCNKIGWKQAFTSP